MSSGRFDSFGRNDSAAHDRSRPLRIAMLVPPWYEVPPSGYGGVEQVCAALIDGLVARGHRVTLVGAGTGTSTRAEFCSTTPQPQFRQLGEVLPELLHVARANRLFAERTFDVIHDHTMLGPFMASQRKPPTVVTAHNSPLGDYGDYLAHVDQGTSLVAVSHAQRRLRPDLRWARTIHNGLSRIGPGRTEPSEGPVLWLARFSPDKGPDLAIEACRAAGLPLVLAGRCNESAERRYLCEVIEPRLGPDVELVINADRARTNELLAAARCLIMPLRWEEPFGMVMIEAMAVGTPVVALNRGAVPEIVVPGETGFICAEESELPPALIDAAKLDPAACVAHVRQSFSAERIARRYERVYRAAIAGRADSRPPRVPIELRHGRADRSVTP
jgi:Glycosyl transferases group 1/Glycosyltransferase Family 4